MLLRKGGFYVSNGDGSIGVLLLPGEPVKALFLGSDLPSNPQLNWTTLGDSATVVFAEDSWPFSDSYPSGGVITIPADTTSGYVISTTASGSYSCEITCGGKTASGTITVENPLQTIEMEPTNATVAVGGTQSFVAFALYLSGGIMHLDGDSNAIWSSSDTSVATVTSDGIATGAAAGGPVTISVQYSGVTATASLTVTSA